jgi:DNA processing protein
MASQLTDRQARLIISIAGEPGDERVGQAVAEFGATEAVERWECGYGADAMCKSIDQVLNSPLIEQAVKSLNSVRGRFITPADEEWPESLDDLDTAAPVGLWCTGEGLLSEIANQALAVVGARSATAYGQRIAHELGVQGARANVGIISGAAYGIDAAAHRGALAALGKTVAVLACGVDVAYPVSHRGLLSNITDAGIVVSEAPPGSKPHKHRFLVRNRLIAALSQSTVVVEAALRSGSLSTSNWAHVLNRQIWGIPGLITSATSAGVHAAIRDNMMKIATSTDEIFQDFKSPKLPVQLGLLDGAIVGLISQSPRSTHDLAMHFGSEVDFYDLQGALTMLEVRKLISLSNQGWKLVK